MRKEEIQLMHWEKDEKQKWSRTERGGTHFSMKNETKKLKNNNQYCCYYKTEGSKWRNTKGEINLKMKYSFIGTNSPAQRLTCAKREGNIYSQENRNEGNYMVFYCSTVYWMKTFPFRGPFRYFAIVHMVTMVFIKSIQNRSKRLRAM